MFAFNGRYDPFYITVGMHTGTAHSGRGPFVTTPWSVHTHTDGKDDEGAYFSRTDFNTTELGSNASAKEPVLVSLGKEPDGTLSECQGDCDHDSVRHLSAETFQISNVPI